MASETQQVVNNYNFYLFSKGSFDSMGKALETFSQNDLAPFVVITLGLLAAWVLTMRVFGGVLKKMINNSDKKPTKKT